jgi:hypothetical protein
MARQGWQSILKGHDVAINAIGGTIAAFVGSVIVSVIRSPKLLDDQRVATIDETEQKAREGLGPQVTRNLAPLFRRAKTNQLANIPLMSIGNQN